MTFLQKRSGVGIVLLVLAVATLGFAAMLWMRSLAPRNVQTGAAPAASAPAVHPEETAATGLAPGLGGTVELSDAEQKAIGVETTEVRRRKAETALLTVGRVAEIGRAHV